MASQNGYKLFLFSIRSFLPPPIIPLEVLYNKYVVSFFLIVEFHIE
jgi:hypothetical protein